jgi:DNA primase
VFFAWKVCENRQNLIKKVVIREKEIIEGAFGHGRRLDRRILAGKWDYSVLSRVQQANDIIEVISEHLNLDKRGKELVGLCPFHTDHRPSMYVNPTKQIFKCFACGAGGDVLKFVQMKENLTFPQAVERLAQRAGIKIEPVKPRRDHTGAIELDGGTLAKMNAWAMNHWISNLWDENKGAAAREYIQKRQLTEESARKWQLGLALDDWNDLGNAATAKKVAAKYLVQAGLAVEKERGGGYDKFRNRLMFPIVDATGRVIGFGGRTLGDDPAKYMNSPATALFDKSHSMYGLFQARQAISASGTVVVVEGYTDVMMAHQFGIENVVAALGTSLTSGHAKILRRYAKRIVLIFDNDVAGKAASSRALEVCLSEKVDVQIAFVPEGKDPCDFLLEAGADAFRQLIDNAEDVLEFKWKTLESQLEDGQNLSDRTEAIRRFLQTAAAAFNVRQMDSISRTVILSRLSGLLKTPTSKIEEELTKIQKQKRRAEQSGQSEAPTEAGVTDETDLVVQAQREILEVLLADPSRYEQIEVRISPGFFGPDPRLKEIADVLFDLLSDREHPTLAQMYGRIESPQTASLLAELDHDADQKGDPTDRLEKSVAVLEQHQHERQMHRLKQQLDPDEDEQLKKVNQMLSRKKGNIRSGGMVF